MLCPGAAEYLAFRLQPNRQIRACWLAALFPYGPCAVKDLLPHRPVGARQSVCAIHGLVGGVPREGNLAIPIGFHVTSVLRPAWNHNRYRRVSPARCGGNDIAVLYSTIT